MEAKCKLSELSFLIGFSCVFYLRLVVFLIIVFLFLIQFCHVAGRSSLTQLVFFWQCFARVG